MSFKYCSEDWPWVWAVREVNWRDAVQEHEIEKYEELFEERTKLPVEIISPYLYLGSYLSVLDAKYLKEIGITHVLNLKGHNVNGPKDEYKKVGIQYYELRAKDEDDYPMLEKHYEEATKFIQDAKMTTPNAKIVIHCVAGLNRAGLIAATEIMLHYKMNVIETMAFLRFKRRTNFALTNEGFQEQLVAFARQHNLLGPKPGTADCTMFPNSPPPESERAKSGLFGGIQQFND